MKHDKYQTFPPQKVESKIKSITRISISEKIAQQLMDRIFYEDLKSGQRLPLERDLYENFGYAWVYAKIARAAIR